MLTKEHLYDMGIKAVGDVLAIMNSEGKVQGSKVTRCAQIYFLQFLDLVIKFIWPYSQGVFP